MEAAGAVNGPAGPMGVTGVGGGEVDTFEGEVVTGAVPGGGVDVWGGGEEMGGR